MLEQKTFWTSAEMLVSFPKKRMFLLAGAESVRIQAGGETDQEELNRHLLQRLAEEATLVIEAQEAADTAIMAGKRSLHAMPWLGAFCP